MTVQKKQRNKRGVVFHEQSGKLYVFEKYTVNVLKAWPKPMAWKKTTVRHLQWFRFRPSLSWLNVVLDCDDTRVSKIEDEVAAGQLYLALKTDDGKRVRGVGYDTLAWLRWYCTIPREIRQLLKPFRKRKWHLLSFIASAGQPAIDLIRSNPALAFALASNWVFHTPSVKQPLRSARALLKPGKKQTDILRWLGFPATKSAVRILGKYHGSEVSIPGLLLLRELLWLPEYAKLLAHQPKIDRFLLYLLSNQTRGCITPGLIAELRLAASPPVEDGDVNFSYRYMSYQYRCPELCILKKIAEMFRLLRGDAVIPRFTSLDALVKFYYLLDYEMQMKEMKDFYDMTFLPPFLGSVTIQPLTTGKMLLEEGNRQSNCVASYANAVAAGRCFIYRMLAPQRCTIALEKDTHGCWQLTEMKLSCNREPSPDAVAAVQQWLAAVKNSKEWQIQNDNAAP